MWNSPSKTSEAGKRYELVDLSPLVFALGELRDFSKSMPVANLVDEPILKKLERSELIFALHQIFNALLEDVAIPQGGHTGIQEATVAELLSRAHQMILCEMENPDDDSSIRKSVWMSVDRLLNQGDSESASLPLILEGTGLDLTTPHPYRSPSLTPDLWEDLLLGEAGLWSEFLWDADWRIDSPMDLPPASATALTRTMGLDLHTVQALPHTPSDAELQLAEHYLHKVIRKHEMLHQDSAA